MTDGEICDALTRMVRKQDYWRGYLGDEVTDEEVIDSIERAYGALKRENDSGSAR